MRDTIQYGSQHLPIYIGRPNVEMYASILACVIRSKQKHKLVPKMANGSRFLLNYLSVLLLLLLCAVQTSQSSQPRTQDGLKTEVFLSPEIVLEPGLVSNKNYYDIEFPRGHIALKMFNAELVDEKGNPVPLHETYLHHWVLSRYYKRKGTIFGNNHDDLGFHSLDFIEAGNSGICDSRLSQYYGLGAETRKTGTDIPDPFGIELSNPLDIPPGYEEGWYLNIHAIDTRGVVDKMGCTECRCDLYNVTRDIDGELLPSSYKGGLRCCQDEARCKLRNGFNGVTRRLYLRYIVKYVDWDEKIVPVNIYIHDVADIWTKGDEARGIRDRHICLIEYDVEACPTPMTINGCTHSKRLTFSSPFDGDVIYGVGHQHAGSIGLALHGEGGREICSSVPLYGEGEEAGDEAGYVVGMSTCYPAPGSIKISSGEMLTLVSNYSSTQEHIGVMGHFYLLIAPSPPKQSVFLHGLSDVSKSITNSGSIWPIALFGAAIVAVVILAMKSGRGREEGYEAMI